MQTYKFCKPLRKLFTVFLLAVFVSQAILPAYAQSVLNLSLPGKMIATSPAFSPAIMTGMTVYPENPLKMDFIIDIGDDRLHGKALEEESKKLINYFMTTLTVPDDEMWVNLSPYEKDRIVADGLGKTEMGRDMLSQDYILKQLAASLLYPEGEVGKKFWNKIYSKIQGKLGTTDVPTDLFNKVWIVPQDATVYVNGNNVFVTNSHLKVMLEQDYLALESNQGTFKHGLGNVAGDDVLRMSEASVQIVRDILLPEIEKEVNEGKNFANLRQIYHSMILATWYKQKLKNSFLERIYLDKNKTGGIELDDKTIKNKIYAQYVEAFKKGVYNYIREDVDLKTQEIIPRKYFSGGLKGVGSVPEGLPSDDWIKREEQREHVVITTEGQVDGPDKTILGNEKGMTRRSLLTLIAGLSGAALFAWAGIPPLMKKAEENALKKEQDALRERKERREFLQTPLGQKINQLKEVYTKFLLLNDQRINVASTLTRAYVDSGKDDIEAIQNGYNEFFSVNYKNFNDAAILMRAFVDSGQKDVNAIKAIHEEFVSMYGRNFYVTAELTRAFVGSGMDEIEAFREIYERFLSIRGLGHNRAAILMRAFVDSGLDVNGITVVKKIYNDFLSWGYGAQAAATLTRALFKSGQNDVGVIKKIFDEFQSAHGQRPDVAALLTMAFFESGLNENGVAVVKRVYNEFLSVGDHMPYEVAATLTRAIIARYAKLNNAPAERRDPSQDIGLNNTHSNANKGSLEQGQQINSDVAAATVGSVLAGSATNEPTDPDQTKTNEDPIPGGIDLNAKNLNIREQGQPTDIRFSLDNLENIQPENVDGILPVIINISPVTSFSSLIGFSSDTPGQSSALAGN